MCAHDVISQSKLPQAELGLELVLRLGEGVL